MRLTLAIVTAGLLVLWPGGVGAHGGPPTTHDVLLGSGDVSLVTSHGFFAEDSGWAWVCEEVTGADLAASTVRTPSRWLVGTLTGLRTSPDGCEWSDDPALLDTLILRVLQDVNEPDRAWVATMDGLWVVDGLEDATLEVPVDFSLRHLGQRADGALLLVGFDGPEPVAQLDELRLPLPAETGRIEVLSADDQGRFYLRFPAGLTDRLIRVSEAGAEVVLPVTDLIRDVLAVEGHLYVLHRDGVAWSADDGATWAQRGGEPITCLRGTPDGFYACPPAGDSAALWFTPTLPPDPSAWSWSSSLDFAEVTRSRCQPGSTARLVCPYLWGVVAEELGVVDDPATVAPAGGCGAAPGSWWWLGVCAVVAVSLARRRSIYAARAFCVHATI